MKLLGVDYGDRKIGIAFTDTELGVIFPRNAVIQESGSDVLLNIKQVVVDESVEKIVVGLPVHMDGNSSEQTNKTQKFIDSLKENLGAEVISFEERLTTEQVDRKMRDFKVDEEYKDSIVAMVILENYLETI